MRQYELSNVKFVISKSSIVIDNKQSRKIMSFIRIGMKSSSHYSKATKNPIFVFLFPKIKMRQLSHNFLNSIFTDISDILYWSDDEIINDLEIESYRIHAIFLLIGSKCSSILTDNSPVLQFE